MRLSISLHTFLKSFRRGLLFSYIFSRSAAIFYIYLVRSRMYRVLRFLSYCINNSPRRKEEFKKVCSEIESLIYMLPEDGLARPKHVVKILTILIF
jgi:hypothetical protein